MPWSEIVDSHGFWAFLGGLAGVIGTFGAAFLYVITGKEIGFRDHLLQRIKDLEDRIVEQRVYYEARIEEQNARLAEQSERHRADMAQLRKEYRDR